MKLFTPIVALIAVMPITVAQAEPPYESCAFVLKWARQAMHISQKIGLEEEKWIINDDGYAPDEYAAIIHIKHEAYHDVPALIRRVDLACGKKDES